MSDLGDVTFREGLALMAPLMEQSARDLAFTTTGIIDSLAMECAESAALIAMIREEVEELVRGPYMPTPARILAAMYPARDEWWGRAEEILQQRGVHSSTHGKG